jgi:sugar phosphate isomerase/epimerase
MKHPLSLHHLTALDVGPAELVEFAAELGCDAVCLFTHVPARAAGKFPCIDTLRQARNVRSRLADTGLSVCNVEIFDLCADTRMAELLPGLERAAILGATRATVHIRDADECRASERLGEFCAAALPFDITVGLEFTGFSAVNTIAAAAQIVRGSGASNVGIAADALHIFRNGMSLQDVSQYAWLISYAQVCDGRLASPAAGYYEEALGNREIPGRGEFPLTDFIALLARGVPISAEVPLHRLRDSGIDARERCRLVVEAARRLIPA